MQSGRKRLPHQLDLREFNFGTWDGRSFDDIANEHPELSRAYWENPGDVAPPNGESWNAAAERISNAVDQLVDVHMGQNVIVVSHFGAILTQLQRALGISPEEVLAQPIDNLSITQLERSRTDWKAGIINHIA